MKLRRQELVVGLLGLLLGGGLLLYWLSPRIISFEPSGPAATTAVSGAHPIQLTLNRSLDESYAGQFLQIEPPMDGRVFNNGRVLHFLPANPWPFDQHVQVTIHAGWPGGNGLPLWRGQSWTFQVGLPDIYYTTIDETGSSVWTITPESTVPTLWLRETGDIVDMSMSSDGRVLLLTLLDENGQTHLIQHHRFPPERQHLLTCGDSFCRQPQLQPGGSLIAYERRPLGGLFPHLQVWLLDSHSGQSWPAHSPALFAEPSVAEALATPYSHSPRWSPDGRTLAYFKPDAHLIILLDIANNVPPSLIPAQLNEMGGWSPGGESLTYTELTFGDPAFYEQWERAVISGENEDHLEPGLYNHVMRTDLNSGETVDLSEGLRVEESGPAWSPDGRYLAFSRSYSGAGRQLWLSDADGGNPRPLTDDPFYHHSSPRWSPDGRYLLFMRSSIAPGSERPSIELIELATGQMSVVAVDGFMPGWRP